MSSSLASVMAGILFIIAILSVLGIILIVSELSKKIYFIKACFQRQGHTLICVFIIFLLAFSFSEFLQVETGNSFLNTCPYKSSLADIFGINSEYRIYAEISLLAYIPVAIGLYYFYYRIQRSVSESYVLRFDISFWNLLLGAFLFFSCLRVGVVVGNVTLYEAIVLLVFIIWFVVFARGIFQRLRTKAFFGFILERLSLLIDAYPYARKGPFKRWKSFRRNLYQEIEWNFDILYQIIEHSINKSVDTVYIKNFQCIRKRLVDVSQMLDKETGDKILFDAATSQSVQDSEDEIKACVSLFKNLLRDHKKICILLYEKYRNNEYDDMWNALVRAYPQKKSSEDVDSKTQRVINEFFKAYWSLAVYFSERDRDKLQSVLQDVSDFVDSTPERNNQVLLLRALIVHAIERDNISLLTEICYLQELLTDKIRNKCKSSVVMVNGECFDEKSQTNLIIDRRIVDEKDIVSDYQGMNLFILFQASIKSIELSLYKITGFLAKYIVSHYKPPMICEVCKKIRENRIVHDRKLEENSFYYRLGTSFNINSKAASYFFKKMVIILRIQQNYRYGDEYPNDRLSYDRIAKVYDFLESSYASFNLEYCVEKIVQVGEDYGMLSIEKFADSWKDKCEKCKERTLLQEFR